MSKSRNTRVRNLQTMDARRRQLRRTATPAERMLWQHLRHRGLQGRKFKRQYSVGPYVLDFFCAAERLGVELDGEGHGSSWQRASDQDRTDFLHKQGIRVIRFENRAVFDRLEVVLAAIAWHFKAEDR